MYNAFGAAQSCKFHISSTGTDLYSHEPVDFCIVYPSIYDISMTFTSWMLLSVLQLVSVVAIGSSTTTVGGIKSTAEDTRTSLFIIIGSVIGILLVMQ